MQLQGKLAVITGAGSGIGAAIARALAKDGCHVVLTGRRVDLLNQVAAECAASEPPIVRPLDVTDRTKVAELFAAVAAEYGTLDILIHAAGSNVANRSFADTSAEQWDFVLAANATGMYNCLREAAKYMRPGGLMVNISSVAGLRADASSGIAYIASKFAATGLSSAAALEFGKCGIRVTNICPGDVNTPLLDGRNTPPGAAERAAMLQPDDVAKMVLAIARLPARAHVAEVIIKPTNEDFV